MVFDPKLNSGVAFNQPVSQPNAMEAVAGLFNFGVSSLKASAGNAPKPTEDEKFAMAMRAHEEEKGGAFSWDRKGLREFMFKYPQFTSQAKAWGEAQSIVMKSPEETAVDSTQAWFGTDEGIVTVWKANQLPEEEREAYIMGEYSTFLQENAEIAKIDRQKKILEAEGALVDAQWKAIMPTSKAFADNTVETIVGPILQEVMNGVTVDIDPALQQKLDIRYDSIGVNNINAFLQDTRNYLETSLYRKYQDNFGEMSVPSEDWTKQVLGRIDGLIEIGKQFDSPQEQLAFTQAIIDNKALHLMDENNLAVMVAIVDSLPPDVATRITGTIASFDEGFAKLLTGGTGAVLDRKAISAGVQDMSTADADTIATESVEFLDKAFMPEVFTAFNEATKKNGYTAVDEGTFKTVIGQHADAIVKLVASDSEARVELTDFISSDIQKSLAHVRQNLPAGVLLKFDGKQFTLAPEPGTLAEQKWNDSYRPYSQFALNSLPKDMSLNTVNAKIATLGVLGPMGKEIQEAIGILNASPEDSSSIFNKIENIQPTSGEVTKSSKSGVVGSLMTTESGGNFKAKNNEVGAGGIPGHFGRLQFGVARLNEAKAAGVMPGDMTPQQFLQNPEVQIAVEQWHINDIVSFAENNDITKYIGSSIKGVPVTMDGLIAVAHLGGKGGLKKFVESGGEYNPADANGTSLLDYLNTHQGSSGGFAGSAPAYGERQNAPLSVGIDSAGVPIPESVRGSQGGSAGLSVGALTFESPEVQEVVAKAQTEPQAAIAMAKEILKKPMDPSIKSLIEALVKIGERA